MKSYVKPLILASEDLSEGVFAASGMIGGEEANAGGETGGGEESHVGGMGGEENGSDMGGDTNVDPGIADPGAGTDSGADNGGDMGGADNGADMGSGDNGGEIGGVENGGDNGGGDIGGGDMGGGGMGGSINEPVDEATASYSFTVSASWDGNKNYDLSLTSDSDRPARCLVATIPYTGIINAVDGELKATINGDSTITVRFSNYGNLIQPHETVKVPYTHVAGTGDFNLM